MTVVDSKDGEGVEISCYKTHCCSPVMVWSGYGHGMDLPCMMMIKCTDVV